MQILRNPKPLKLVIKKFSERIKCQQDEQIVRFRERVIGYGLTEIILKNFCVTRPLNGQHLKVPRASRKVRGGEGNAIEGGDRRYLQADSVLIEVMN